MLQADWLLSVTFCIFLDLIGSYRFPYFLKLIGQFSFFIRKFLFKTIHINPWLDKFKKNNNNKKLTKLKKFEKILKFLNQKKKINF